AAVRAKGHDMPWQAVPPVVPAVGVGVGGAVGSSDRPWQSSAGQDEASESACSAQSHPVAWVRALRNAALALSDAQASAGASCTPRSAEDAALAKARAVALLQRLFFEELSKGQDANGAAASALRRLTEQTSPGALVAAPNVALVAPSEANLEVPLRAAVGEPVSSSSNCCDFLASSGAAASPAWGSSAELSAKPRPVAPVPPRMPKPAEKGRRPNPMAQRRVAVQS
ncbi:unnamed protein product, partial [Polarella glacialis]